MYAMRKLFLLLICCLLMFNLYTQEKPVIEPSNNVLHISLGSFVLLNSVNLTYDRLLTTKEDGFFKSYYFTAKGGANAAINFSGSNSGTGFLTSAGFTGLTGKGKNHFEVGLGLGYFFETSSSDDADDDQTDDSQFYPQISIGYRKQTTNGFLFRTGLGVAEWAYIGFGYSF